MKISEQSGNRNRPSRIRNLKNRIFPIVSKIKNRRLHLEMLRKKIKKNPKINLKMPKNPKLYQSKKGYATFFYILFLEKKFGEKAIFWWKIKILFKHRNLGRSVSIFDQNYYFQPKFLFWPKIKDTVFRAQVWNKCRA